MTQQQVLIAPSILAADLTNLQNDVATVTNSGADWLHVDVMDGCFVPPITFGANMVATLKDCTPKIPLDVHLMITNPEQHVEAFADAGSSTITIHPEATPHLHYALGLIHKHQVQAGAALNPGTPVEILWPVLELCDLVLIMTVNPGWGGQEFIETCLSKIITLRQEIDRRGLKTRIEVDGGINITTGQRCVSAGADVLVAGTYIFGSPNRAQAISALREATTNGIS